MTLVVSGGKLLLRSGQLASSTACCCNVSPDCCQDPFPASDCRNCCLPSEVALPVTFSVGQLLVRGCYRFTFGPNRNYHGTIDGASFSGSLVFQKFFSAQLGCSYSFAGTCGQFGDFYSLSISFTVGIRTVRGKTGCCITGSSVGYEIPACIGVSSAIEGGQTCSGGFCDGQYGDSHGGAVGKPFFSTSPSQPVTPITFACGFKYSYARTGILYQSRPATDFYNGDFKRAPGASCTSSPPTGVSDAWPSGTTPTFESLTIG